MRALNATLNDGDWQSLDHDTGIGYVPNSDTGHGSGPPSLSPGNRDPSSIPQPTTGNFETRRRADGLAMEFTSSGTTANRLTISVPPTATVSKMFEKEVICFNSTLLQLCHPSHIINEALLKMVKCILI